MAVYRFLHIPRTIEACYGRNGMRPDDHRLCERRHAQLLARIEQLEENQRTVLELLREFRHLLRAITGRLEALDQRIEQTLVRLVPLREAGERIARHFRN